MTPTIVCINCNGEGCFLDAKCVDCLGTGEIQPIDDRAAPRTAEDENTQVIKNAAV